MAQILQIGFLQLHQFCLFIVAVCTLFLAKKIFKRFEYQAVKPEQIKHMLNFYDFLRNYHFELDLYVINDDDKYNIQTKGYFYYFSNCKALSRGVNQLNEREEIEAEYLTLPILFKDSQFLYSVFYNFIFNYLTPIEIVGILKELSITGAQDIEKEMNQYLYFYDNPNYIMEVKKKTSSVIYTNLSTFSKKSMN